MRYRVFSASSTLLIACFFSGLAILVAILTIIGGISPNAFENSSIATFDLTAFRANLEAAHNDTSDPLPAISDWYSVHMTTVCQGSWTPETLNRTVAATREKINSTTTCTPYHVNWAFALGTIISSQSPSDAASPSPSPLLAPLDAYTASLSAPAALLLTSIATNMLALTGLFATAIKHGFSRRMQRVCLAAILAQGLTAVFALAAAALVTTARARLVPAALLVAHIQSFGPTSFLALVWVAAVLPLAAAAAGAWGLHRERRAALEGEGRAGAPVKLEGFGTSMTTIAESDEESASHAGSGFGFGFGSAAASPTDTTARAHAREGEREEPDLASPLGPMPAFFPAFTNASGSGSGVRAHGSVSGSVSDDGSSVGTGSVSGGSSDAGSGRARGRSRGQSLSELVTDYQLARGPSSSGLVSNGRTRTRAGSYVAQVGRERAGGRSRASSAAGSARPSRANSVAGSVAGSRSGSRSRPASVVIHQGGNAQGLTADAAAAAARGRSRAESASTLGAPASLAVRSARSRSRTPSIVSNGSTEHGEAVGLAKTGGSMGARRYGL